MTNREQRRSRARQQSGSGAGDSFARLIEGFKNLPESVEAAHEEKERELARSNRSKGGSVTGDLPLPNHQELTDDRFIWTWEPIEGVCHVTVILLKETESWSVDLSWVSNYIRLTTEQTLEVAGAMLAAQDWPNSWRLHAATFLLNPGEKPKEFLSNANVVYQPIRENQSDGPDSPAPNQPAVAEPVDTGPAPVVAGRDASAAIISEVVPVNPSGQGNGAMRPKTVDEIVNRVANEVSQEIGRGDDA